MIELALIALLALVAAGYVAEPLRRRQREPAGDPRLDELGARKRSSLQALVDLESEHAVGKLSDEDFDELYESYSAEAVVVLDEIDAAEDAPVVDPVESEIASVRARLERGTCPRCGASRRAGTRCPRCGA